MHSPLDRAESYPSILRTFPSELYQEKELNPHWVGILGEMYLHLYLQYTIYHARKVDYPGDNEANDKRPYPMNK